METSPLTKELYSIDWATRFEHYQKYEKANFDDLYSLLSKIEETVEKNLSNKKDLDTIVGLRTRMDSASPESSEWHYLSMLIHFRTIKAALSKGLTATATLSAIQVMGHMWNSIAPQMEADDAAKAAAQPAAEKSSTRKSNAGGANSKNSGRAKVKSKSTTSVPKSRKSANEETAKAKPAAKQSKRKEAPVTENVVIKKLTADTETGDDKPLATRCHDVANSLADEYPQYTLTAIRVMTAEKLGVTRQYVENLDIKPARFK